MSQPPYGQNDPNRPPYGPAGPEYGSGPPGDGPRRYGPNQPYSPTAAAYGDPVGSGAKFGVVGATLAGIGAVLLIVAYTAVDWLKFAHTSFGDLHDAAQATNPPGLTKAYFGWLGWVVLIVCVVVAIAANLPTPAAGPLRAIGAVLAVAAIVLTLFALKGDGTFSDVFTQGRAGLYLALGGYLLVGIGALVGPDRVVRTYRAA